MAKKMFEIYTNFSLWYRCIDCYRTLENGVIEILKKCLKLELINPAYNEYVKDLILI
jgi:hypothetical protein